MTAEDTTSAAATGAEIAARLSRERAALAERHGRLAALRGSEAFRALGEARQGGRTASRWEGTRDAARRGEGLLARWTDTVEAAHALIRDEPPDLGEATRLLREQSVHLTPAEMPKQERPQPGSGSASASRRYSLARVSQFVDEALDTVSRAVRDVTAALESARPLLDDLGRRLGLERDRLGSPASAGGTAELDGLDRRLAWFADLLPHDPLALAPGTEERGRLDDLADDLDRRTGLGAPGGGAEPGPAGRLPRQREAPDGLIPCLRSDCDGGGAGRLDAEGFCGDCNRPPRPPDTRTGPGRVSPGRVSPGGAHPGRAHHGSAHPGSASPGSASPGSVPPGQPAGSPVAPARPATPPLWYAPGRYAPGDPDRGQDAAAIIFPAGIRPRPPGRGDLGLGFVDISPQGTRPAGQADASGGEPMPAVIGQYEIEGRIGSGGQSAVYRAKDLSMEGDPVAIKIHRNLKPGSREAAYAEFRALRLVRHPDIVDIRAFVTDPGSDEDRAYIVLEFLDGETLAEKTGPGPLPADEAIAYVLGVMPALAYLHEAGWLYNDFKPNNVMRVGDRMKLIDLGGATQIDAKNPSRPVFTPAFMAPELRAGGQPTVRSDLYSVGRTLAMLTMGPGGGETSQAGIPEPDAAGLLGTHESFYRFLRRATARDPRHRFGSAAEAAGQLTGVLREVAARRLEKLPGPLPSALFTPERDVVAVAPPQRLGALAAALALPVPLPDGEDPAAGFLRSVITADPDEALGQLDLAPEDIRDSIEVASRYAQARIGAAARHGPGGGQPELAPELAAELAAADDALTAGADARDWRVVWYRGLLALAAARPVDAWPSFARIRDLLPGELAPKLALAMCAELDGEWALARHYHETVWRTDHGWVNAAFGLARARVAQTGNAADAAASTGLEAAITALEQVPQTLRHHAAAQMGALRLRLRRPGLRLDDLQEAGARLTALGPEGEEGLRLKIDIWEAARRLPESARRDQRPLLGAELSGSGLGTALERAYLGLRAYTPRGHKRVALVKKAHAARPRTRW
jgi:serine/threonine-protein kinase PknG